MSDIDINIVHNGSYYVLSMPLYPDICPVVYPIVPLFCVNMHGLVLRVGEHVNFTVMCRTSFETAELFTYS